MRTHKKRTKGLSVNLRILVSTTFFLAALLVVAPTLATPANVHVDNLFATLTHNKPEKTLTGRDFRRYPKLAAIVVRSDESAAITSAEIVQRIGDHVKAYKKLHASIDINGDGRVTPVEIARRAPRLLVYFTHLDLDRDGAVTLNELLASRIHFFAVGVDQNRAKSAFQPSRATLPPSADSGQFRARYDSAPFEIESEMSDSASLEEWEASEQLLLSQFFHSDRQKDDEPPERLDNVVVTGPRFIEYEWSIPDFGLGVYPTPEPPGCVDGQCVDKAKCDAEYEGDIAICNMMHVPATPARVICYGIAFGVYSNCLRGR
jgi:hypothetical protein